MYKVSRPYILLSATYRLLGWLYSLRLFVVGGKHIAMAIVVVGHICTQNIFRGESMAHLLNRFLYEINICIVVLPTLNADDTDSLSSLLSSDSWRIKYLGNECFGASCFMNTIVTCSLRRGYAFFYRLYNSVH